MDERKELGWVSWETYEYELKASRRDGIIQGTLLTVIGYSVIVVSTLFGLALLG